MKILVTGGAGYIGSITAKALTNKGHEVVVFDNLINGHKEAVSTELIVGDLLDKESLRNGLAGKNFDGVIHFAAYALAGESMQQPYKYFQNNILGGLNLLEFMRDSKIKNIIFSSTCAVYGTPKTLPVTEESEKSPESVYGESKLMFENVLNWYDKIYGIKHINLRYFNAAGAALDGSLGEDHVPETHIIPVAIEAALTGSAFSLFGNDYDTPDGTCIRDYIHVEDLATAHILALEKLGKSEKSDSFNLGTGKGYSNLEILSMVEKVSGAKIPVTIVERREGDPPQIFADNRKAREGLGFTTQCSDLATIVETAFAWHRKKPK
ncbi:MAG: UDP-glucose 4-epimerase GalE [Candidatus Levyibacteriota bacterium]